MISRHIRQGVGSTKSVTTQQVGCYPHGAMFRQSPEAEPVRTLLSVVESLLLPFKRLPITCWSLWETPAISTQLTRIYTSGRQATAECGNTARGRD
jgi:hypothetical protein